MENETETTEEENVVTYGVFGKNGQLIDVHTDASLLMQNLTVKQFKLMLRRISVSRDEIVGAMRHAIADDDAYADAVIEYDYSTAFERTHPLVSLVAARLGFTEEQMDSMWRHAMTL